MLNSLSFFIKIISALLGFGILVFFHELGHFIVAKIFKVKVEIFALGWGPKIWGFKRGDTQYQISAIPIGGFCKFKGDELLENLPGKITLSAYNNMINHIPEENQSLIKKFFIKKIPEQLNVKVFNELVESIHNQNEEDIINRIYKYNSIEDYYEIKSDIDDDDPLLKDVLDIIIKYKSNLIYYYQHKIENKKDKLKLYRLISKAISVYKLREPDSFYGVPPYKRLLVAFAGPFMNYLMAVFFFIILAMGTHKEIFYSNRVAIIDDQEFLSPAREGGVKNGDKIIQIDDNVINDYEQLIKFMIIKGDKDKLNFIVERDGKILKKVIYPEWDKEQLKPIIGVFPYNEAIIQKYDENIIIDRLGLKDNDRIIGINGDYANMSAAKVNYYLSSNYNVDTVMKLNVVRNSRELELKVDFKELRGIIAKKDFVLNFYQPIREIKGLPFLQATQSAIKNTTEILRIIGIAIHSLVFKPKKNVTKQFGGPVMIGAILGNSVMAALRQGVVEAFRIFFQMVAYISIFLAFFNLLPFPAVDGGHILLNFYEIITRRTISMKVNYIINMIGFLLLIILALFVLYLDIFRLLEK